MRNQNQCSRGTARGQPQHAAQLGAPLRLSRSRAAPRAATASTSWSSCESLRRRAAGDAQHLLGDRAGPPARRGPEHAAAACWTRGTTSTRTLADRVIEESLAVRSIERTRRGGAAAGDRAGRRPREPRGRARARLPLGDRLAARRPPRRRRRRAARRASSCSTPAAARPRGAPRAGARAGPAPRRLPHAAAGLRPRRPSAWCAPSARSTRPRSCSAAARRRSRWSAGSSTRCARSAPPPRCSSTARRCRSPGDHGIPSLGSTPIEAVERLKGYVDSGRIDQAMVVPGAEEQAAASRVPAAGVRRAG